MFIFSDWIPNFLALQFEQSKIINTYSNRKQPHKVFLMSQKSLSLKLELLNLLRNGQIEQIQTLITKIKDVTKINPELYQKFNQFITENKEGLIEMRRQEKEQVTPQKIVIENVDGDIDDKYNSDDSWSVSSQDQQEEQPEPKEKKLVLTQLNNKPTPSKIAQHQNIKKDKPMPTNPNLAFKKTTVGSSPVTNLQTKTIKHRN